jgi:spectinomycin phosphotransferase
MELCLLFERSCMIEKPNISDEKIISALRGHYSIPVIGVEFLPIGNDASAWAYRVETENQNTYFLKVRKDISNPAGFIVPRFLQDHGIAQVLAPLPTKGQELWIDVEDFFLILYPFVTGNEAMEVGMSDSQWMEFGSLLRQIHGTELPSRISKDVRRETFIPKWSRIAKELHKSVNAQYFDDPCQRELANFWQEKNETIQTLMERTEQIGKRLQQTDVEFALCHADIHTANLLLTVEQDMFIVDWDDTLFAPKERDLMFVLGEDINQSQEEQRFFEGYGTVEINQPALTYYRYEWCIQEIGDFGTRVFLTKDSGEDTKRASVKGFIKLFSQGDVIESAFNTRIEFELRDNL